MTSPVVVTEAGDLTFYNVPGETGAIGKEYLACVVKPDGHWKLYRGTEHGHRMIDIGTSWVTLTVEGVPPGTPLPENIRRIIAENVFRCRQKTVSRPPLPPMPSVSQDTTIAESIKPRYGGDSGR